jgi:acetylornithine deacetylase/succinyl-diaminopimelate desuccinylase-like protein/drug/metabolite transporter (DMT)-like permease
MTVDQRPAGWKVDSSLVAVALVWGATFVLVKQALADVSTLLFLTLRFSVAAVALAFIFRREFRSPNAWTSLRRGAFAGLFLFGGYILQTAGLKFTSASKAGFLTGLYVPLVPLIGGLLHQKLPQISELLGIALACVGMVLLTVQTDIFSIAPGDLLVAGCAVAYAIHVVILGRFAPTSNMGVLTVAQIATGALLGAATFWWVEPVRIAWSLNVWIALAVTSILATALAFTIQTWAQRWTSPTRTALIFAMEPVFAWVTSYILLGEVLSRRAAIGAALILGGILIVELKPFRAIARSVALLSLAVAGLGAQTFTPTNPAALAARQWREQHERAIVDEFVTLLAIPDIAADHANIQRNAETIAGMLQKRGIPSKLVAVPGGNPVVFGEIKTPGATRTIVFYAHYDGQPLDPKEWATPPFTPTLRDKQLERDGQVIPLPPPGRLFNPEWRLYARGAADDKAPIIAMLAAMDAIRASGIKTKSNIKFAFEGEEEAGSTNLEKTLAANQELFSGDLWLMCDGPLHQTRRQLITFGARGIIQLDITVLGPRGELHSGHYGNWAPNPALLLVKLLASMKDDTGHVLVDHFYDDVEPLSAIEQRAVAEAPDIDADLKREFWLGSTDGGGKKLTELITLPSLNIRGMASSRIGNQASNVIPSSALATLDIRLVKGMDPQKSAERVIDHIRKQGFFVVDQQPGAEVRMAHPKVAIVTIGQGEPAVRTPMDLPISQEVIRVAESARGPAVKLPNMGGTLPLLSVERPLGTHTIVIPIGNHDNNQHSYNENLRIQNLWDGIELMAALLTM